MTPFKEKITILDVTIAKETAELTAATAQRTQDAAAFELQATSLTTTADQDGEIFGEDWSLDAAIAAKELSDLQRQEQLSLEEFDTLETTLNNSNAVATRERSDLAAALSTAEAVLPEQEDATITEGKYVSSTRKHYMKR